MALRFVFSATGATGGEELWISDGTLEGTQLLKDLVSGSEGSPNGFVFLNGRVFFRAQDGDLESLWVTDGTEAGTMQIELSDGGPEVTRVSSLSVIDNTLYFRVETELGDSEPWVSDGTAEGTMKLADIAPGDASSFASNFTALGSLAVFFANDQTSGREPWVSDG
ncbi:MAG: hypothetical protein AAGB03_10150, partial [Pseudomonadota bacterium]